MSNLNKSGLCRNVQNKINNLNSETNSSEDFLLSAFSADRLSAIDRDSVILLNDLPDASCIANGHILYVEEIGVPVISSNGIWLGLDGRPVGYFTETTLWAWGSNVCGRLGEGTTLTRCVATNEITASVNWKQASAGGQHSAALKETGDIWSWGRNSYGQLGDTSVLDKCSPVREICSATDWQQVSAGYCHTAAVKTSGELWVWGINQSGRLGNGGVVSTCSPVREFCSGTDWCYVNAGGFSTLAIKTGGELWVWGGNVCGRLGDGTITDRCSPVREICSATDWCLAKVTGEHSAAVKTSGEIWNWGKNACGQLGDGTIINRCSPIRELCSATDWCTVAVGSNHTIAIKTSGELWVWGSNGCGSLGDGTITNRCSPVREFCSSTEWYSVGGGIQQGLALKTDSTLWAWGSNFCGALGDLTITSRCSPIREALSATDWCSVSVGSCHSVAIRRQNILCR